MRKISEDELEFPAPADPHGQIPPDHELLYPTIYLDRDDVRVRVVPTDIQVFIGVRPAGEKERLLSPGEAENVKEKLSDTEIVDAMEEAVADASFRLLADISGVDEAVAYLLGAIDDDELVEEVTSRLDRALRGPGQR